MEVELSATRDQNTYAPNSGVYFRSVITAERGASRLQRGSESLLQAAGLLSQCADDGSDSS
jgi:hypothetical protein